MKASFPPQMIDAKRQSTSTSSDKTKRIFPAKTPFNAHAKGKTFADKQSPEKLLTKAMSSRIAEEKYSKFVKETWIYEDKTKASG